MGIKDFEFTSRYALADQTIAGLQKADNVMYSLLGLVYISTKGDIRRDGSYRRKHATWRAPEDTDLRECGTFV